MSCAIARLAMWHERALGLSREAGTLVAVYDELQAMTGAVRRLQAWVPPEPPPEEKRQVRRGRLAMQAALDWSAAELGDGAPVRPRQHFAALYGVTPMAVSEARRVLLRAPELAPQVLAGEVMLAEVCWEVYRRQRRMTAAEMRAHEDEMRTAPLAHYGHPEGKT